MILKKCLDLFNTLKLTIDFSNVLVEEMVLLVVVKL